MTIDYQIDKEIERHKERVQQLRDLLKMYQQNNGNYYVERNMDQAINAGINADTIVQYGETRSNLNPYAKQIEDLQKALNEEIKLHEDNMASLNKEREELTEKKDVPAHIDINYIAPAIEEIKRQVPGVSEIRSKGFYYDSFSKVAYVSVLNRDGLVSQVTLNKKDYDLLSEYFNSYPEDIKIHDYEKENKDKDEEVKETNELEDDKLSKEEIIDRLIKAMFPEGADYTMLPDIKRNLESKSIEELQESLEEYNKMSNQNPNNKPLDPTLNGEDEQLKDDLMNEIITAMYPDGVELKKLIETKNSLGKKTTPELQQMLEELQKTEGKENPTYN